MPEPMVPGVTGTLDGTAIAALAAKRASQADGDGAGAGAGVQPHAAGASRARSPFGGASAGAGAGAGPDEAFAWTASPMKPGGASGRG